MENVKKFFKSLKKGQHLFGDVIATIVNSVLLTLVYFIGVGLTSLFAKISGKHFLDKEIDLKKDSYWEKYEHSVRKKEDYYRQF